MTRRFVWVPLVLMLAAVLAACGGSQGGTAGAPAGGATAAAPTANGGPATLVPGAYTTTSEAYGKLLPIFKEKWKQQSGQDVTFQESYQGSGAQSRAIVEGFEADIAALSLEADISRIQKAGLITNDWKSGPYKGMVSD